MNRRGLKISVINILSIFNALGTAVVIGLMFHLVYKINQQLLAAHDQTAKAVEQVQASEREQIKILRCQFALFGENRTVPVSIDQLDDCMKGTSLDPNRSASPSTSDTPASSQTPQAIILAADVPDTNQANPSVHLAAVTVPSSPRTQATRSNPTSSAPPPEPNPTAPSPNPTTVNPQPEQPSSILQPVARIIEPLADISGILVNVRVLH